MLRPVKNGEIPRNKTVKWSVKLKFCLESGRFNSKVENLFSCPVIFGILRLQNSSWIVWKYNIPSRSCSFPDESLLSWPCFKLNISRNMEYTEVSWSRKQSLAQFSHQETLSVNLWSGASDDWMVPFIFTRFGKNWYEEFPAVLFSYDGCAFPNLHLFETIKIYSTEWYNVYI